MSWNVIGSFWGPSHAHTNATRNDADTIVWYYIINSLFIIILYTNQWCQTNMNDFLSSPHG